jgi:opacity protein-like surface antigen
MSRLKILVAALVALLGFSTALAQNIEVTGQVGGQINGGVDLSTSLFNRLEVRNGVNYGITAGYLVGEHGGIEFQWNRNQADTVGQRNGVSSAHLFNLTSNQYMGNFLFHLTAKDHALRPFAMFGLGANALSTDVSHVSGSTRFAFALGGGAKFNMTKHLGFRGQLRWVPTYLGSTNAGYWCDPFWGGCWVVGNSHYLHEFDITGGITLRF